MARTEKSESGLRVLVVMFGSLALFGVTYVVASNMLNRHHASVGFRAVAIIIGILGFVLWQAATARLILMKDEFTRRIHLIAVAFAFAAVGLFIFTADLMQRAGFIDYILLRTIWLVMSVAWSFALIGTGWYYRR